MAAENARVQELWYSFTPFIWSHAFLRISNNNEVDDVRKVVDYLTKQKTGVLGLTM